MGPYVIYKITGPSGKVYIGRTNDFDGRMACHKYLGGKDKQKHLYRAIAKNGWDNFTKEIIDTAESMNEAISKELKYIVDFDSVSNGYNCTYETEHGGDIWDGLRETDKYYEHVKMMSILNSGVGNGMFGKTHKEETKLIQKAKAKGRFSLPWFIERNGEEEGKAKYDARCYNLSITKRTRDEEGNFIKKTEPNRYKKA